MGKLQQQSTWAEEVFSFISLSYSHFTSRASECRRWETDIYWNHNLNETNSNHQNKSTGTNTSWPIIHLRWENQKGVLCVLPAVVGGPQGIFESAGSVVTTDSWGSRNYVSYTHTHSTSCLNSSVSLSAAWHHVGTSREHVQHSQPLSLVSILKTYGVNVTHTQPVIQIPVVLSIKPTFMTHFTKKKTSLLNINNCTWSVLTQFATYFGVKLRGCERQAGQGFVLY